MLGLGAVEMVAFDCMRRVRAREVVARAYGDAGTRCAERTARREGMRGKFGKFGHS